MANETKITYRQVGDFKIPNIILLPEQATAPLAKELIDHIDVYESEGKGKNKTQRIVIYYRFVGYIELPDKIPIVNDTRQGVAVNYISGALPETA